MRESAWVNQSGLAMALGITARRVRQLISDRILPSDRNGKWHLATCRDRYEIFTHKTERDLEDVENNLDQRMKELERMLEALTDAEDDKRRGELLPKAVAIHIETFELMMFMVSVWSKSASERELMLRLVNYEARDAFAPIWRAVQIVIGHKRGVNPDLVRYDPDYTRSAPG
jgi:hypothetical protein